ncbi:hypothetical protein B7P43_G08982 [Cryptotermes secundus]|uniref:Uncharacterized protein n=1 Tax=Cryptotermes secundus TaxID=105785 RepID=A0A2J7QFX8_9NEOP|nr:hypothetical protein B7P43_G08982 [Cryptotermes secundus]
MIRNIRLPLLAALCLFHSRCSSSTLQFSQSSDRHLALYHAPAPYQEAGRARLSSVIITSRPFSIGDQLNSTTRSNANIPSMSDLQWRREFITSSHPPTTSTTTVYPRSSAHIPHYSIDCSNGKSCSETININSTTPPTFKPYSQEVLEKFLNDYAVSKLNSTKQYSKNETPPSYVTFDSSDNRSFSEDKSKDLTAFEPTAEPTNRLANLYLDDENEPDSVSIDGKSKPHWSLVQAQHHNHPYDDRDGWVTLEAIPWSSSKISKWQSSNISNKRPHWESRPQAQDWNSDKPSKPWERPQHGDYNYKPTHGHHQQWITSSHPDIITEGTPENWPVPIHRPGGTGNFKPWPYQETDFAHHQHQYDDNYKHEVTRRPPTPVVYHDGGLPQNYPESGEGEWVLLSSTKGYSKPIRHHSYQRALTLNPRPITATRSVRLTVLPALNGTANTTTSHGGLLEVESTFQTVDEAQRDDANKRIENDTKPVPVRLISTPVKPKGNGKAVLAAVGAGMLPATMALLVPMLLGRKKRSTLAPNMNLTATMPAILDYASPKLNNRKENAKKWEINNRVVTSKEAVRKGEV